MGSMTRRKMVEVYRGLTSLAKVAHGVKLSYAVAKSRNVLRSEIESLQAADKPSPGFTQYERERVALAASHAVKEPDGSPVQSNNEFVLADVAGFESELEELREKHASALEGHEKQRADLEALLDTSLDVALHSIPMSALDDGTIQGCGGEALAFILEPLLGTFIIDD